MKKFIKTLILSIASFLVQAYVIQLCVLYLGYPIDFVKVCVATIALRLACGEFKIYFKENGAISTQKESEHKIKNG